MTAAGDDRDRRVDDWMDHWFDPAVGLLWNPEGSFDDEGLPPRSVHLVPQSGWYAIALARRGDGERLAQVLDAILATQYRRPGEVWDGTYARFAEFPIPGVDAVEWVDYDPNWRQFLGTSLTLLLRRHRDLLDDRLAARVEESIAYAVASEPEDRLGWHYTNIALKQAWLLVEYGDQARGLQLASEIHEHWSRTQTFPEFNSPTYDGIDLWALSLWRGESSHPDLRTWGAEMEAGLWRTIASRFHAGLGNTAGPYGRAYGLDMHRYIAQVALWIDEAGGTAPVPWPDGTIAHTHDLLQTPAVRLAGTQVPDDARAHLRSFQGERSVEETITNWPTRRHASAWLGDELMLGGEHGDSNWSGWSQFVAGTAHWRRSDGGVVVLRVIPEAAPKLRAEPGALRSDEPVTVEVHQPAPGHLHSTAFGAGAPGVTILEEGINRLPGATVDLLPDRGGHVLAVTPRP